jgi:hypothetical protein
MNGAYLNNPGYEVPDNTILVVPHSLEDDGFYKEVIRPLKGEAKREWFGPHFYYCLPLSIGNQYGFIINSLRDFEVFWDGTTADPIITFLNEDNSEKQIIQNGFGSGIVTIQNKFAIKTPIGINVMTIQPPNDFIPACVAMTGVIETDNIKRDFTFNLKITVPNLKITVKKGDSLGAFIPIQRYFVDNFKVGLIDDFFSKDVHKNELLESGRLTEERNTVDKEKPHQSGRRYFKGINSDDSKYRDHQNRL